MQTSLTLGQTLIGANQGHLVAAEGFRSMFRAHAPGTEEGGVPSATRNEADPPETKPLNFATHDWNATARRLHRLVFFFSPSATVLSSAPVCTIPSSAPFRRLHHTVVCNILHRSRGLQFSFFVVWNLPPYGTDTISTPDGNPCLAERFATATNALQARNGNIVFGATLCVQRSWHLGPAGVCNLSRALDEGEGYMRATRFEQRLHSHG